MSYKIKSLVYLACLVAASLAYHNMNRADISQPSDANELAKVETHSASISETVMNNIP